MKLTKLLAIAAASIASIPGLSAQTTFSGSMLYGYCTTAYSSLTFNEGNTGGVAMQMNESALRYFRGCKITAIAVANGTLAAGSVTSTMPIELFVTEVFNEDALQSYSGEMDLSQPFQYKEYVLPEPITITESMQPVMFGYKVVCNPAVGNPIVTDGQADQSAGPGDWIGLKTPESDWAWEQLRNQFGMPCVRVKIEGSALPANDVAILESHLPTYAAPNGKGTVGLYVRNDAGNPVSSIDVAYSVNGGEEQSLTVNLPSPLIYNDYTVAPLVFDLPMADAEGNDLPVSIDIARVNGAANNAAAADRQRSTTYLSLASGYDRAMVAEVATATWCGWCPRGIAGVSKMAAAHADDGRFIPIAAHYNDVLTVQSYDQFFGDNYTGGSTPSCMINRNKETFGTQDPSQSFLESAFAEVTATPALCSVAVTGVEFNANAKTVKINAEAEFAIGVEGEYGFAYVITENGVGPYDQTNYFSPSLENGFVLEWWDEQPNPVSVTYDAVARNIYPFRGLKGSLPAEIEARKTYSHSASVQTNLVGDMSNCNIIVMVVNRTSTRIENAVSVPYSKFSSIHEVDAAAGSAQAEYFDLQGRRVAEPQIGKIYIERHGPAARKVMIQK